MPCQTVEMLFFVKCLTIFSSFFSMLCKMPKYFSHNNFHLFYWFCIAKVIRWEWCVQLIVKTSDNVSKKILEVITIIKLTYGYHLAYITMIYLYKWSRGDYISCSSTCLNSYRSSCTAEACWRSWSCWIWNAACRRTWGGRGSKGGCPSDGDSGSRAPWWCGRSPHKRTSLIAFACSRIGERRREPLDNDSPASISV